MRSTLSRRPSTGRGIYWARGSPLPRKDSVLPSGAEPGRIAALDLGEARTGVALSDPGGSLARPLEVVPSEGLSEYLRVLLAREDIAEVVVGVPKTLAGEVGFQAGRVLDRLAALRAEFTGVRFVEWDERFTTRLARSGARRRGRRRGRTEERVDHLAAAAMLQEYLERRGTFEATRQGSS